MQHFSANLSVNQWPWSMAHVVYADAVSVVSDWRNLKAKSIKIQERSRLSRKNEFSADNAKFYKIPRVVKL